MGPTIYKGHPSWRSPLMVKFFLASLFCVLILGVGVYFGIEKDVIPTSYGVLGLLAIALFSFGSSYLYRNRTLYSVTPRGVRYEAGFPIRTSEQEISFSKVTSVTVRQGTFEKLFLKTGTVDILTPASDPSLDDICFQGIDHPHKVATLIRDGEDRSSGHHNDSLSDSRGGYRPSRYDGPPRESYERDYPPRPTYPSDRPDPSSSPAPWEREDRPDYGLPPR